MPEAIDPIKRMYIENNSHLIQKLAGTKIETYPFPHIYISDVFTEKFYQHIKDVRPRDGECVSLKELGLVPRGYPNNRSTLPIKDYLKGHLYLDTFVQEQQRREDLIRLYKWFRRFFMARILDKFNIKKPSRLFDELLYVVDRKGYSLHTHTDYEMKIFTALLYMPEDSVSSQYGTNIDVPEDPTYTAEINKYNPNVKFNTIKTTQYIQNSMFIFLRTNNSFHSVSEIKDDINRYVLTYDIKKDL